MILAFAVILTCLMLVVMITDVTRFIIPNWLVGLILLLYPVLLLIAPARPDWLGALLVAGVTFGAGFVLFFFRMLGGGDVKLLAVLALFAGKPGVILSASSQGFPPFIVLMLVLGGLLALMLVVLRPVVAGLCSMLKNPPTIARVLTVGEPVPYGVAIAGAFLITLWAGKIPGILL